MAADAATALLLRCVVITTLLLPRAIAAYVYGDSGFGIPRNSTERFLYLQNQARADVGVAPLAWDGTVAAYAEKYAAARKGDCDLKHSGGPYGENIFWGSAGANWTATDAVASWASEKQWYNCSDDSCDAPGGRGCTHYKQMVWAKTTKVGCASVSCDANRGTFMVCEYDPPGNVPGVQAYAGCGHFNQTGLRQNDAVSRGEDWRRACCGRRGFAHTCPRGEIQGRNPRYALRIHSRYSKIQGGLAISSDGAAAATGVPDELGGA
ncbi:hypothetical protein OsJ_06702 [Oryza sativa Japonica Group]|uniref:SCP domain-containing protein n=1 Tax=Oryza sativa subsp. japonica TaxID=39947 RepID=A3A6R8_ORYSJ|nr:hypothetical protein OsJ_06702 [Oryza sativa Japonica Group]